MNSGRPERRKINRHLIVLTRTEQSVKEALGTQKRASRALGEECGRWAIMKFLRVSLRVEKTISVATKKAIGESLGPLMELGRGDIPTQAQMGFLLNHLKGSPSSNHRKFGDRLERRGGEFNNSALKTLRSAICQAYVGEGNVSLEFDGTTISVAYAPPPPHEYSVEKCWEAILDADKLPMSVSEFAHRFFREFTFDSREPLIEATPRNSPKIEDESPIDGSKAVYNTPSGSTAATQSAASALSGIPSFVINLGSLKPRGNQMRPMAPLDLIPSRRQSLDKLRSALNFTDPFRGATPGHSLVTVTGPAGVGKSEFLYQWLLSEQALNPRRFGQLLYISDYSTLAHDVVMRCLRDYLALSQEIAVIVIDGLKFHSGVHRSHPDNGVGEVLGALNQAIGKRQFVAVMGIQTMNLGPPALPDKLLHHPILVEVPIVEFLPLNPLDDSESRILLRELSGGKKLGQLHLDGIVKWSRGLPLLLAAAVTMDRNFQYSVDISQEMVGSGRRLWGKLDQFLQFLNAAHGPVFAAMRLVSLFRRSLSVSRLQEVVRHVKALGQPVERVDAEALPDIFAASWFFSEGPGGGMELHQAVRDVVSKELTKLVKTDKTLFKEVRGIHLVAARIAFAKLSDRRKPDAADEPSTQLDLELTCDCAHHLLCTRTDSGDPETDSVPWPQAPTLSRPLPKRLQLALYGQASNAAIERSSYDLIFGWKGFAGSDFSSRGLFANKLAILHRFVEPWQGQPASADNVVARMRRRVCHELAACSIVVGQLDVAVRHLDDLLSDLFTHQSEMMSELLVNGEDTDRVPPPKVIEGAIYVDEVTRIVKSYASALMRMGRIDDALKLIMRTREPITDVAMRWLRVRESSTPGALNPDLTNKIEWAHAKILTRLAECRMLISPFFAGRYDSIAQLNVALEGFEEANFLHRAGGERLDLLERNVHHIAPNPTRYMLRGESARSYVRCLLRLSQSTILPTDETDALRQRAKSIVNLQLEAARLGANSDGWSNDTISFMLDLATIERLEGSRDLAQSYLEQIIIEPKFANLGACSMAVRLELKLEQAKLAVSRLAFEGRACGPEVLDSLSEVAIVARDTGHRPLQMDAVLLKGMILKGDEFDSARREASAIYENCDKYNARNDVFDWLNLGGRIEVFNTLSIAA